jgi:gluconate 2-dehydrogenase gamma chain
MSNFTPLIPEGSLSRRDMLRNIALALTAGAGYRLTLEAAQHVHQQAKEEKQSSGIYQPKFFNDHEYSTLNRLTELIIPADEVSGSAKDAGAPEFIDLLCSQNAELANTYTGGLAWLDGEVSTRFGSTFLNATPEQQIALLDSLVETEQAAKENRRRGLTYEGVVHYEGFGNYGFQPTTDLGPGVFFIKWLRKMTVDAFYTSEIGIKDIDYQGNAVLSQFEVPQKCIDYALQHSPFRKS